MANKKQTQKRRVQAVQQQERQQANHDRQQRRKRLLTGGVIAFLALALIAPLTAGLISTVQDDDPAVVPTTIPETQNIPWVSEEDAGVSIAAPIPCPAEDGSEVRATEFAEPPPACIEAGASFELDFETAIGSFTLPVDAALDAGAANLAVVFGRYHTYERTPVNAVPGVGLLSVGSPGNAGFTIPATPPTGTVEELYPIGSVVALAQADNTISGSLMVVLEEAGRALLQATPRHVVIGMVDDLSELQAIYETPESDELTGIDAVVVRELG